MFRICKKVYDLNGAEVKATDIPASILDNFEAGTLITLRNNNFTFWADVECIRKTGSRYYFKSELYGWVYIVNVLNNTVMSQQR